MREFGAEISDIMSKVHSVINRDHFTSGVKCEFNFKVTRSFLSIDEIRKHMQFIYNFQKNAYKLNLSFGFILQQIETKELRYYYPQENDQAFKLPAVVTSERDLTPLINRISNIDVINHIAQERPTTKWVVFKLCNVRYSLFNQNYTLGAGHIFPEFIKSNKYIETLDYESKTGAPLVDDNTCVFRCIARHLNGDRKKGITKKAKLLLERWLRHKNLPLSEFTGVQIAEMGDVEKLFDISIHVYELKQDSHLSFLHKPLKKRPTSMNVLDWNGHMCYISQLSKLRCFKCRNCEKLFKKASRLKLHEKRCTDGKALTFNGKYYRKALSIFEKLENFGICVPEEHRYCKYFAVFDFEAILKKLVQ